MFVGEKRTFRCPFNERWLPILLAAGCLAAVWIGLAHPSRRPVGKWRDIAFASVAVLGALWFVYGAWIKWSTSVMFDDGGVHWRAETESASLPWDQIEGLCFRQRGRSIEWSLVEKGTGVGHPLPLMPRALFVALKERVKSIPPEAEEHFLR